MGSGDVGDDVDVVCAAMVECVFEGCVIGVVVDGIQTFACCCTERVGCTTDVVDVSAR